MESPLNFAEKYQYLYCAKEQRKKTNQINFFQQLRLSSIASAKAPND